MPENNSYKYFDIINNSWSKWTKICKNQAPWPTYDV